MTAALTIAFVPGVSPAKWVRVWRERFPDAELGLLPIGPTDVDQALTGEADMAFARMPVGAHLNAIPLWTETAVVAMPKDGPLASADVVTEADLTDVHVVDAGPVPEDVSAALDLVEANVGVVVLPQSLFRAASRKDLVAKPLDGAAGTRIALVWRDADASDTTEEFIGVVRGRTANSSRNAADRPGGTTSAADDGSRGARGGSGAGRGSGGSARSGGGKATAKQASGGKAGGKGARKPRGSGRPGTQRLGNGKPKRGSKGNR
ncbi:LysR family transcriptional regulator substrate-binding protein [Curtobacterium sp. RHCJP20]|uniref:LysR family transcriptional regulator substrate-binding protein n=1 Tax=Curtobacterium subtropicum TaxID=3055138 RepID=A0ABT7THF4_9MICO|nr:LysR family transcriptional regulator substrate-binding protein [Curtobacterium subtropicum]MDM7888987.1 LysR family transcriptional regulator substrate-binding protein [Curtobacterium subtropicum]